MLISIPARRLTLRVSRIRNNQCKYVSGHVELRINNKLSKHQRGEETLFEDHITLDVNAKFLFSVAWLMFIGNESQARSEILGRIIKRSSTTSYLVDGFKE
jgi:hypothetical protein